MSVPEEERTAEQIQADIEKTREDLGETAEALAAKADVKGQAKAKVEEVKSSAREKTDEAFAKVRGATPEGAQAGAQQAAAKAQENPVPLAIAGAFALGIVVGIALKRG
jgi:ElaB/YqjD/DUF883 family membrane-anchored ribosome-binding protein